MILELLMYTYGKVQKKDKMEENTKNGDPNQNNDSSPSLMATTPISVMEEYANSVNNSEPEIHKNMKTNIPFFVFGFLVTPILPFLNLVFLIGNSVCFTDSGGCSTPLGTLLVYLFLILNIAFLIFVFFSVIFGKKVESARLRSFGMGSLLCYLFIPFIFALLFIIR